MNPSSIPKKAIPSETAAESPDAGGTSRLADAALCAWFVLVGVAFWGPYAGLALPFNILTALYAAFLLLFIASAALHLLRQNEPQKPAPAADDAAEGKRRRGK